jgi:hypothetical protein
MITGQDVAALIRAHDQARPRSQQKSIGPSGLGNPCSRNLAYHALSADPCHVQADILPAWVGTQAHKGMDNIISGQPGWHAELECEIPGHNIPAHVDAYHQPTGLVLDWKFVGDAALRKHRSSMSPQYRTQVHLYGFAVNATYGWPVHEVAVCLIPRNGPATSIHVWAEPYDEAVVEEALARWHQITVVTNALGGDALPLIPTHPDANCQWCPWWNPTTGTTDNLPAGCPGTTRTQGSSPPPWQPEGETTHAAA